MIPPVAHRGANDPERTVRRTKRFVNERFPPTVRKTVVCATLMNTRFGTVDVIVYARDVYARSNSKQQRESICTRER